MRAESNSGVEDHPIGLAVESGEVRIHKLYARRSVTVDFSSSAMFEMIPPSGSAANFRAA